MKMGTHTIFLLPARYPEIGVRPYFFRDAIAAMGRSHEES